MNDPARIAPDVPKGKVRLSDGSIIDRADAAFGLQEHKDDKNILIAIDGTVYQRQKNGSLRRLSFKPNEIKTKKRLMQ